jgi:hypothetical protein
LEEYILSSQKVSTRTEWDGDDGVSSCTGRVTFQPVFRLLLLMVLILRLVVYSSGNEERSEVPPEDDV